MHDGFKLASEALTGFADGALYDFHRPSFPPEDVHNLLRGLQVANEYAATMLDLAATRASPPSCSPSAPKSVRLRLLSLTRDEESTERKCEA